MGKYNLILDLTLYMYICDLFTILTMENQGQGVFPPNGMRNTGHTPKLVSSDIFSFRQEFVLS